MRRKLVSSDEAVPAKGQHVKACSDCPWRRDSLRGWLGGLTAEEWIGAARGDAPIHCHVLAGAQCAGAAIYRANTGKLPRDPGVLRLERDPEAVFATPGEFAAYHEPKLIDQVRALIYVRPRRRSELVELTVNHGPPTIDAVLQQLRRRREVRWDGTRRRWVWAAKRGNTEPPWRRGS